MSDAIGRAFLEYSDKKLVESTKKLTECLGRLSEEQVWARGAEHENAIGNLLLHLSGNMRQWIMHGVGGQLDVRTRDAEFAAAGGLGKAELMALWTSTLDEARGIIRSVPMERLTEIIRPQRGYEVTMLGAIYQVVEHVSGHVGQIILLTKQMVRKDLDLTIPRAR